MQTRRGRQRKRRDVMDDAVDIEGQNLATFSLRLGPSTRRVVQGPAMTMVEVRG